VQLREVASHELRGKRGKGGVRVCAEVMDLG
jgi:hypothetical protein